MKKMLFTVCMTLFLLCVMLPAAFASDAQGWTEENGTWKYYENGAPLTGVRWIESAGNRYLFNENGAIQMGDTSNNISAGRYLFEDSGLLVREAGWHVCNDGKIYRTNDEGQFPDTQDTVSGTTYAPYDPMILPQGGLPLEYTAIDIETPDWHYSISGDEISTAVLTHINAIRAEKGLAPLLLDEKLNGVAIERCRAYVNGEPLESHEGMKAFEGWEYRGENSAKNYGSACDLLANGLYTTPASYEQLMIPGWKRMGIGYAYNQNVLQGLWANGIYAYWVLVFE